MNNLLVIVLAGGKSSRMKRDKALLLGPDGKTLLDIALTKATVFAPASCYVSGNYSEHPHITDIIPDRGPLGGIHASIEFASKQIEYVLFLPVDMPDITQSLLMKLWLNKDEKKEATHFDKCTLPLILKTSPHLKSVLNTTLSDNNSSAWSIHSLLSQLSSCILPEEEDISAMNINTPEQFSSWRHSYES